EALQRLVLDRLPALVWTTDRDLRITVSAGGGLGVLGLEPGQIALVGTSLYSYFHTEDPSYPPIAHHLRALDGESTYYELEWNGRRFQTRVEPLRDRSEQIVGCIGVAFDVTEASKTAQTLRVREAQLRRLVEANAIGIIFSEESGRITEANDAFLEL